jgi:hypothetical protein
VVRRDIGLDAAPPIPPHSEHDNGPYIKAGPVQSRHGRPERLDQSDPGTWKSLTCSQP